MGTVRYKRFCQRRISKKADVSAQRVVEIVKGGKTERPTASQTRPVFSFDNETTRPFFGNTNAFQVLLYKPSKQQQVDIVQLETTGPSC